MSGLKQAGGGGPPGGWALLHKMNFYALHSVHQGSYKMNTEQVPLWCTKDWTEQLSVQSAPCLVAFAITDHWSDNWTRFSWRGRWRCPRPPAGGVSCVKHSPESNSCCSPCLLPTTTTHTTVWMLCIFFAFFCTCSDTARCIAALSQTSVQCSTASWPHLVFSHLLKLLLSRSCTFSLFQLSDSAPAGGQAQKKRTETLPKIIDQLTESGKCKIWLDLLLSNIPFLKYMRTFPHCGFCTDFSGRFSQPEDVLPLSFNQTLRRTSYLHLLYHASRAGKGNLAETTCVANRSLQKREEWGFFWSEILAASFFGRWQGSVSVRREASNTTGQQKTFLPQLKLPGHPHFVRSFHTRI